ncbi:hypothetical protein ABT336_05215 [Micromonospora sp. NPDC000207]|uniref:hypothetical protein n=1 Tax=Micromonospora sp. NPDC000207 TaxID=3154246 RepID=UPI003333A4CE
MVIPLPRPAAMVDLTRSALDQALGSAASLAAVPARAFAVLDSVDTLITRINGVVDRIEETLDRTDRVVAEAGTAVRDVAVISAAATTAIENATEVATAAARVVDEAQRVSTAAAVVVGKAEQAASAAATVVAEAGQVADGAATVVARAEAVTDRAAGTIAAAQGATVTATELLDAYEPTLRRGAPMANRFVEELSQEEVTAAIRLVDELPKLKEHLTADILPILATLDRVGPDVHDLLDVTRDLKLAVAGIPGLGMFRRRGARLSDEQS